MYTRPLVRSVDRSSQLEYLFLWFAEFKVASIRHTDSELSVFTTSGCGQVWESNIM